MQYNFFSNALPTIPGNASKTQFQLLIDLSETWMWDEHCMWVAAEVV